MVGVRARARLEFGLGLGFGLKVQLGDRSFLLGDVDLLVAVANDELGVALDRGERSVAGEGALVDLVDYVLRVLR